MKLALPEALRAQMLAAARAAHPAECCGLIIGARNGEDFAATALHEARNLADRADRFEIDPADHFAALKAARAAGARVIGCYHSHPNGVAQPSATDLAGAGEAGFVWLIVAGDEIAAFLYEDSLFTGADLVMSSS